MLDMDINIVLTNIKPDHTITRLVLNDEGQKALADFVNANMYVTDWFIEETNLNKESN